MGFLGWIYNHHYRGGMRDVGPYKYLQKKLVTFVRINLLLV